MKKTAIAALLACVIQGAVAQTPGTDDPTVMTINGIPVSRSEFEYSYNKNNSEGVIDKKTIDEYVDLFINYKLKVAAALDAHYDTLTSFKQEFAQYRDQQVRPAIVNDKDMMAEAHHIYDETVASIGPDGLVQARHILLRLPQQAPAEDQRAAKVRIDSIYQALLAGADFAELATKLSQDPGSAREGGLLPWAQRGQFFKEFEDVAFSLQPGEMSKPFESPVGYHIIKMDGRKMLEPFDFHKESILQFMEQRNIREQIATRKVDAMVEQSAGKQTKAELMDQLADSLSANDSEMKNLIREYYEGLLLYEISNNLVWDKAAKDEAGLQNFFKKNKKKYAWTAPRFKGIAYHVKDAKDVEAVKNCVKKLPFAAWNEALRTTFNGDSIIRIRVEKGLFKQGDNQLVDSAVFKKDVKISKMKDYPIDAVYGKILKKGPEDYTDVRGLVTADYQDQLEKVWVEELRRKYRFEVNKDVLKTVNNH